MPDLLPFDPAAGVRRLAADLPPTTASEQDPSTLPNALLKTLGERWGEDLTHLRDILAARPLLSFERAGLGAWADAVLGGGVKPGEMIGVGATGAGAGKTAFVHQLADGWAQASAEEQAGAAGGRGTRARVAPVVYVSEMHADTLSLRTLARRAEVPGKHLRAPAYYGDAGAASVRAALAAAPAFRQAAGFITPIDRTVSLPPFSDGRARPLVEYLKGVVDVVRRRWERDAEVQTVVLVVDPLHRLLPPGVDEVSALSEVLGELLGLTQREGLVSLFTSDTTKVSAGNRSASTDQNGQGPRDLEAEAEQSFRGSYQLLHVPDHAFAVQALDPGIGMSEAELEQPKYAARKRHRQELRSHGLWDAFERRGYTRYEEWATAFAHLPSPKLRWGRVGDRPAYWYDRALFRFVPMPRPDSPGRPRVSDGSEFA